jgi:hypothetical protein
MHEDVALCLLATDLQENSGKNSCKQALQRKEQFCCLLSRPSRKVAQSLVLLQATDRNNKSMRAPWIHA